MKGNAVSKAAFYVVMPLLLIAPVQSSAQGPFKPNKDSIAKYYKVPEWYRDAKLGIYLHWGPQALPAIEDWYPKYMYEPNTGGGKCYQYHVKNYGHPSTFGYKDLCNLWKAEKFDPDSLVRYFKSIGAGWVCPLGSHHDGFDNWKSSFQEWNTVNVGPKKDLMQGWADAAKKYGMRLGMGYHKVAWAYDWLGKPAHGSDAGGAYDGKLTKADGTGTWWEGMDPQRLYTQGNPYSDAAIQQRWKKELWEAVVNYNLDLTWFDGGLDYGNSAWEFMADFYNKDYKDGAAAHVMCLKDANLPKKIMAFDYEDCTVDALQTYLWEAHTCVSTWFYVKGAAAKPAALFITNLPDIASKNGCMHLNVGPFADGTLPQYDKAVLDTIGAWNAINGEGIFRTRPFPVYGEGSTKAQTTVYLGLTKGLNAKDIRFTRSKNGTTLYIFFLGWPGNGATATIASLNSGKLDKSAITGVTMLGGPGCQWSQDGSGFTITMPPAKPAGTNYAYGFKVLFSSVIKYNGQPIEVISEVGTEKPGSGGFDISPAVRRTGAFLRGTTAIVPYNCGSARYGTLSILSLRGEVVGFKTVSGAGMAEYPLRSVAGGVYLYRLVAGTTRGTGVIVKRD